MGAAKIKLLFIKRFAGKKLNNMPLKALVTILSIIVTTLKSGSSRDTSIVDIELQMVIVGQL